MISATVDYRSRFLMRNVARDGWCGRSPPRRHLCLDTRRRALGKRERGACDELRDTGHPPSLEGGKGGEPGTSGGRSLLASAPVGVCLSIDWRQRPGHRTVATALYSRRDGRRIFV